MHMARRLAERKEYERLAQVITDLPPADAAHALADLDTEALVKSFQLLPAGTAADILAELPDERRHDLLEKLAPQQIVEVMEEMPSDEATDVLQDMEPEEAEEVLAALEPETRAELAELAEYGEESAGGMMAKEFAALPAWATAADALEILRSSFQDVEDLNVVFAVDEENRLVGSCSLRDIVLASPDTPLAELVARHEHWVQSHQDQEEVAHYMRLHDLDAVPVVDEQGHVIGQITLDDAAEVMDEEAAEDLQRITGITEQEQAFGPLVPSLRRRLPWLLLNIFTALVAASVLNLFEGTIAQAAVLAVFMPLVAGQGGNAGSQTLTVFIRSLAVGEIQFRDVRRALRRQVVIGIIAGVVVGSLVGLIAYAWKGIPALGAVVGAAMVLNLTNGCIIGSVVPLVLRRLGYDPAMGSGILVTAWTDASGYLFLFGLGTYALRAGLLGG